MKRIRIHPYFLLLAFFFTFTNLAAETISPERIGQNLVIKLVTIGPGDPVYSWWGHSALVVEDTRRGSSYLYDYGLFSFAKKDFFSNFAMGRLIYSVGKAYTDIDLTGFINTNRDITIQTLNLLPEKRYEIARFLEINIRPENRDYLYHHYNDNCSTRIRDILDSAVGGQLKENSSEISRMTLREWTRCLTHKNFFVDWFLMFLMGSSIDTPITIWDEMFLPSEIEKQVSGFKYINSDGEKIPFIAETVRFNRSEGRVPILTEAKNHWPTGLISGLILGAFSVVILFFMKKGITAFRIIYGIYMCLSGLIIGLPGSILFFMSLFTDHTVTYFNENLFLANPLLLPVIPLGIFIAISGKKSLKPAKIIWSIFAVSGLILILFKIIPLFSQWNWLSISIILPISISFSYAGDYIVKFLKGRKNLTLSSSN